jgi:hypothetical protein
LVGGGVGVGRAAAIPASRRSSGARSVVGGRRGAGEIYACCCGVLAGPAGQMGFLSAKLLPSCESMCVCCPALRPSSRRPVKRYKKLLAEIFPKTPVSAAPSVLFSLRSGRRGSTVRVSVAALVDLFCRSTHCSILDLQLVGNYLPYKMLCGIFSLSGVSYSIAPKFCG